MVFLPHWRNWIEDLRLNGFSRLEPDLSVNRNESFKQQPKSEKIVYCFATAS